MSGNKWNFRWLARACKPLMVSAFTLLITACGSGGGAKSSPPSSPLPSSPTVMNVTKLNAAPADTQAHLRVTNTLQAQQEGYGAGAPVALFSSGINTNNPAFSTAGMAITTVSFLNGGSNANTGDAIGQGTLLAEIVSGSALDAWGGGVVPGNDLYVVRVIPDNPKSGNPFGQSTQDFGLAAVSNSLNYLRENGVQIAGFSWDGDYVWSDTNLTAQLVDGAKQYAIDNVGLIVFAAGDGGKKNPTQLASLPSVAGGGELQSNWLTVAAVDTASPNQLASYSNACGVAKDYCLVAPGDVVVPSANSTSGNVTYSEVHSTQAAMAQVVAAASMVAGAFLGMDVRTIDQILLSTAADLGDPGVDSVYGHGLLNVAKAVRGPTHLDAGTNFFVEADSAFRERVWEFGNDISGEGGLTVGASNTYAAIWKDELILSGRNTYTGATTLYGTLLTVTGSLDSPVLLDGRTNGISLDPNHSPKQGRLDLSGGRLNGLLTIIGKTLDFNAVDGGTVQVAIDAASDVNIDNTDLVGDIKLNMDVSHGNAVVRGSLAAANSSVSGNITNAGDIALSNSALSGSVTNTLTNSSSLLQSYDYAADVCRTSGGGDCNIPYVPYGIIRSENSSFSADLVNDGGMVELIDSVFAGNLSNSLHRVEEYAFQFDSRGDIRLTRSSVEGNIGNGADLLLSDSVINGNVENTEGGVLKNRGGSTINGDVSFGAGSILDFLEGNDALHVTGMASIGEGARIGWGKLNGPATEYAGTGHEVLLQAEGGVLGSFTGVTRPYWYGVYGDGYFFDPFISISIGQDANSVWVDFARTDVAAAAAMFGNITPAALASAQRVEAAFDGIDGGANVTGEFLKGAGRIQSAANEEIATASLRSLSGEMHARADAMTFDSLDASRRAVAMRFGELAGKPQLLGEWSRQMDEPGQGFIGNAAFSMNGWMSGGDLRIGADTVAGFAFGENEGEGHAGPGDRAHQKQTQMQLYAGGVRGNAYALGQLGAGQYQRQLRRGLQLGVHGETVAADYGGDVFTATMEAGYRFGAMVPYAGIDYLRLQRNGFNEAGGSGFGLKANDSSAERVQVVAGMRAQKRWGHVGVHGFAEWQQSLSEDGLYAEASFVGVESWSPLQGEGFSRASGMFGFGVDASLGRRASWSFGYDQRVGSAFDERQWSAKLRYGF